MQRGPRPAVPCGARRFPWMGLWSRRDLLRVGSLGIAATAGPGWWTRAVRASDGSSPPANGPKPARAQSVIFLWMAGGVTHIDSFDPKPDAPAEVRGTLGAIATNVRGIQFCESLPCLAQVADRLAVVRSYSHDSNDHFLSQGYALSGRKVTMEQLMTEPNVGSIVSHLQGPRNSLPGYIAVPGFTYPGPPPHNLFVGGWLGQQHAPFAVGGIPAEPDFAAAFARVAERPEFVDEDLRPKALEFPDGLDAARLARRSRIRQLLDRSLREVEKRGFAEAVDGHYQSALHMLNSPAVRAAFDLSQEPDSLKETYGRTKIGKRCLLARRLIEAGARFVMVDYGYDPDYGNLWDNHRVPVQRQPHICEIVKKPYHLAGMDRAFAALTTDLAARGLLETTLVVFMTEFGRTPKINADGGRDHWGAAGSIFFAGAGTRGGQVIGSTDKQAAFPTGRGHSPADVAATVYRALGIDPETLLYDRQRRPVKVLPEGQAIAEVAG